MSGGGGGGGLVLRKGMLICVNDSTVIFYLC